MAAASSLPFIPSFRAIRNAIATLPLAILAHDNLLSLYRVKGSSMEPTLRDGDVLVVRKSDGIWQRWTRKWPNRHNNNNNKNSNNNNSHFEEEGENHDHDCEWAIERGHVLEYEKDHSRSSPRTGWLRTPPVPVTGNIVVFQDPTIYPAKWSIKRVIGLGGQMVE
jgi:signal peptidase I